MLRAVSCAIMLSVAAAPISAGNSYAHVLERVSVRQLLIPDTRPASRPSNAEDFAPDIVQEPVSDGSPEQRQIARYDAYLKALLLNDELAPETSWAPWQGIGQAPLDAVPGSAMPHYGPQQIWDFNDRLLSNDRTGSRRSY